MANWKKGTIVDKPGGYPFPGRVLDSFKTSSGQVRYNVESLVLPGLIHIFSEAQLTECAMTAAERVRSYIDWLHQHADSLEIENMKGGPNARAAHFLCGNSLFHKWLGAQDAEEAEAMLKDSLGIQSFKQLDSGSEYGPMFHVIKSNFEAWKIQ